MVCKAGMLQYGLRASERVADVVQAVGFLQKMAREMNLGNVDIADSATEVEAKTSAYRSPFVFEPMRRKLYLEEKS